MAAISDLSDLFAGFSAEAFAAAIEEAYARGRADEHALMRAIVMQAIGNEPVTPQPTTHPVLGNATPAGGIRQRFPTDNQAEDDESPGQRAPRGLTREVVTKFLKERPGLAMLDLQRLAVEFDARLSPKTVYNEVNREKDKLYRLVLGRWYLVEAGIAEPETEDARIRRELLDYGVPRAAE